MKRMDTTIVSNLGVYITEHQFFIIGLILFIYGTVLMFKHRDDLTRFVEVLK